MKEEFKKMDELLQSQDPGERGLGLQLVKNHIARNKPCNVNLEKGKVYKVTWMRQLGSLKDIMQRTLANFEGRFTHYENNYGTKYRVLRFANASIRCDEVLEIVPAEPVVAWVKEISFKQ